MAWGANDDGRLGNGSVGYQLRPTSLDGLASVSSVAAGPIATAAVQADGSLWTWGVNDHGQLGDGTNAPRPRDPAEISQREPRPIAGLSGIASALVAGYSMYAVGVDGHVRAWGENQWGQLGDGTSNDSWAPKVIDGLSQVRAVTSTTTGGTAFAVTRSGQVFAWGADGYGQAGVGTTDRLIARPARVREIADVQRISCGSTSAYAVLRDGTVWAWGRNNDGYLGDGSDGPQARPVRILGLPQITSLEVGAHGAVYALTAGGEVWAWDYTNQYKPSVGDGTYENRRRPVLVTGLDEVVSISAGANCAYAVKADGSVWAWGDNSRGKLGDGTSIDRAAPVRVDCPAAATSVVPGGMLEDIAFAVMSDGTVWAWGSAFQLGLRDPVPPPDPVRPFAIQDLSGVVSLVSEGGRQYAVTR